MKLLHSFLLLLLLSVSAHAQSLASLSGNWQGHIAIQGQQLIIKTHFTGDDSLSGTIDIPQQDATGLPLQKISAVADSVFFEFRAGPGLAEFKGAFQSDSSITGSFHQNGLQFPFELKRAEPESEAKKETASTPLPYNHDDLIIKNDSVNIGGTLTWPENKQANQLVIIISGSGAQDRDGTVKPITDFQPYASLADSLTSAGIATFRYDDRGVGSSTGNFGNATLDMLADDVNAIIAEFTNDSEHNFGNIILLGHSQGGIVGGKVAVNNDAVEKLILIASPSVSLDEILQYQLKQSFKNSGFKESKIDTALWAFQKVLEATRDSSDVEASTKQYQKEFVNMFKSLPEQTRSQIANLDSMASTQGRQLLQGFTNPQMQSLMFYEPTNDLQDLTAPVLVLFGGKDTQVTVEMNKEPIEQALTKTGVPHQIKTFSDANHLFQKANTGQVQEYGTLPSQFIDGFLSTIEQWIKK